MTEDADDATIKKAYRRLAIKWHPDKVGADQQDEATERFKEIGKAYAILKDPRKRCDDMRTQPRRAPRPRPNPRAYGRPFVFFTQLHAR